MKKWGDIIFGIFLILTALIPPIVWVARGIEEGRSYIVGGPLLILGIYLLYKGIKAKK